MAFTTYTPPQFDTVHGTFKFYVFSQSPSLVTPTEQTIVKIGKVTSTAYIDLENQEVPRLELEIQDDLPDSGFWYSLCHTVEPSILITLTEEGQAEKTFFYGLIENETIEWETSYIDTEGGRQRKANLTLLSMETKFFESEINPFIVEVANYAVNIYENNYYHSHVIRVLDLFQAFLTMTPVVEGDTLTPMNPDRDTTRITFQHGTGVLDFVFLDDNLNEFDVSQLYVGYKYVSNGSYYPMDYYWSSEYFPGISPAVGDWYLERQYGNCKELLSSMLRSLGLKLLVEYDFATSRWTMKLLQGARAYDTTLTFGGREKEEVQSLANDLVARAGKASSVTDKGNVSTAWASKDRSYYGKQIKVGPWKITVDTAVPDNIDFDFDWTLFFYARDEEDMALWTRGANLTCRATPPAYGESMPVMVGSVKYWDYDADAYVEVTTSPRLHGAVVMYNLVRLSKTWKRVVVKYGTIVATEGDTTSFFNIGLLKRVQLNDGIETNTYFINSYTVDIENSEVELELIQEIPLPS